MIKVSYVKADGARETVEAHVGDSVMMTARGNDVDGIIGECGGAMMCATCHCYIDEAWQDRVDLRSDGEDEMLECAAAEVKATSRLSCQIRLTEELDGLVVHLPATQI